MMLRAFAALALFVGTHLGAAYDTRGVVKSFGPEKKYVVIAHEDIPGYMMAMSMSFEPRRPEQLDGLAPGDKVAFRFTDADGHRLLDAIQKTK